MSRPCVHLEQVVVQEPSTVDGCEDCLAIGARWIHLRMCMDCGHVGCCDSSPNKHATAHHLDTAHPVVQSYEPSERWAFCYVDQRVLDDVGDDADRSST